MLGIPFGGIIDFAADRADVFARRLLRLDLADGNVLGRDS